MSLNESEAKRPKMDVLADKLSEFIGPFAEKLQSMTFLMAVSEAMQALLPVTMVGAFACLFAFLGFQPWQDFLQSHMNLYMFFMTMQSCTLTIYSLYVIVFLPYVYAKKLEINDPILAVPTTVAAFILVTPVQIYSSIPMTWLGHAGLFSAMIITFIVVRAMKFFENRLKITLPPGVPHFVARSFEVLIPTLIILTVLAAAGYLCQLSSFGSFHNLIYTVIQKPIQNVGGSLGGFMFMEFLGCVAMFCGIHGSTVTGWWYPIITAKSLENLAAWTAGAEIPNIICSNFETFVLIGGYGATFGPVLATLLFAKSKRYKEVAKIAFVPQLFNIGEPFLFGVPVMLNPYLMVPYFGITQVNIIIAYIAMKTGLVGKMTGVSAHWTLGIIMGASIGCSTPVRGVILKIIIIIVDMLFWLPFFKMLDNKALAAEKAGVEEAA